MSATLAAILMIALIISSLFIKRVSMQYALYIVPIFCGLLLGFSIPELTDMFIGQVNTAMKSAGYMILFAMIYFNMLSETGMFNTLVGNLVKLTKGRMNVWILMILTSLIAAIGMLTATVATAYLIVFPIMLPIYKKMKFDLMDAMIIAQTAIAGMCFVPWGIAVVNSSVFAGVDPIELSGTLTKVAICFIPAIVLQWIYFARKHKKNGGMMKTDWVVDESKIQLTVPAKGKEGKDKPDLSRPKLFWFNLVVFIAVIVALAMNVVPSYLVFIFASFITFIVDYPDPKEQKILLRTAGGRFFNTFMTLVGISFFIGIFQGTPMVKSLANSIVGAFPTFMSRYIHIFLAFIMVFLIRFMPNKIYNSMYPVLVSVGASFGIPGVEVIAPFVCNMSLATGSSPFTATTHIGTGLLDIDTTKYCNRSMVIQGVTNIFILCLALLFGFIH